MALGYDGKLYILAFDHRGSFQKKMFGIEGDPSEEETAKISDAKHLIFEGMLKAVDQGAEPGVTGVLVDEQFGAPKNVPGHIPSGRVWIIVIDPRQRVTRASCPSLVVSSRCPESRRFRA